MMFKSILSVAAITAFSGFTAFAQEAARFGIVTTEPSTVKLGQTFTVHYNSTLAMSQPKFVDFYIFGTLPSGFVQPSFLLTRNDYPADAHTLTFETTLPVIDTEDSNKGYVAGADYNIIAYATLHPNNDSNAGYEYGGVEWPITVDLS